MKQFATDGNAFTKLREWRKDIFHRDHKNAQYDAACLLEDSLIDTLSSSGPLTRITVKKILEPTWLWWEEYGEEVTSLICSLPVSSAPLPKAKHRAATKRSRTQDDPTPSSSSTAVVDRDERTETKRRHISFDNPESSFTLSSNVSLDFNASSTERDLPTQQTTDYIQNHYAPPHNPTTTVQVPVSTRPYVFSPQQHYPLPVTYSPYTLRSPALFNHQPQTPSYMYPHSPTPVVLSHFSAGEPSIQTNYSHSWPRVAPMASLRPPPSSQEGQNGDTRPLN